MLKRVLQILGAFTIVAAGLLTAADSAGAISSSAANVLPGKCWAAGSGNCYHWARTGVGLSVIVENDVNGSWTSYYNESLSDWTFTLSAPLNGVTVPLTMTAQNRYFPTGSCSPIGGIVRMCNKNYGYNGWLGLASIWIGSDGEH